MTLLMKDYPGNIVELEARFSTEEACRDYLFRRRWPSGLRHPHCSSVNFESIVSKLYECVERYAQLSVINDEAGVAPKSTGHLQALRR
ncbi:MAG: transposase [Desulfovibrionaceae bacterium]|nr:transposase [Desulfovibrionaceae bacterium]MBF0514694.1 transposase [Desulfovibrionaceae bacterium]